MELTNRDRCFDLFHSAMIALYLFCVYSTLQSSADRYMDVFSVLLSLQAEGQKPYVLLSRLHDKTVVVDLRIIVCVHDLYGE